MPTPTGRTSPDSDRRTRAAARGAVRDRRRQLVGAGASVASAYATVLAEALGGALGDLPPGWVHEDFHLDDKDAVFAAARGDGVKIGGGDLVTVSRIYTPDHIVAFLLQNTLGALWLSMHPSSPLRARWPLLVEDAIGPSRPARPVASLTVVDPCCGCGAFLLPALDLLLDLADDERRMAADGAVPPGWPLPIEVATRVLAGNLWGADLDATALDHLRAALRDSTGGAFDGRLMLVQPPLGSLAPATFGERRFDVVCTNPPWIGFRQLAPDVREAVRANDPHARSDLAVAFQSRCVELAAEGGRVGTVTPAGWTNGRESLPLRRRILEVGGPCVTVAMGQGVFEAAPLVFVAMSVIGRRPVPQSVSVLRHGRREPANLAAEVGRPLVVRYGDLTALASTPFMPDAPPEVIACAGRGPRLGECFRSFDGVWTGDNRRDLRFWWQLGDRGGWVRLSGGQGHQPWVAPIRLRIRAEHVAGQPARAGGVEYPRVAGGRLGARVVDAGTASLAGVVTLVPIEAVAAERVDEVLAIFNSPIGGAWLRTLTSGLNFNPGYAAAIPLGSAPPGAELRHAVGEVVALRRRIVEADPTHDGFHAVPSPDEAHDWVRLLAPLERLVNELVADHLAVPRSVAATLPVTRRNPVRVGSTDDALMVVALRQLGVRWPNGAPAPCAEGRIEDALAAELDARHDRHVHPGRWLAQRLVTVTGDRFPGQRLVEPARLEAAARR